MFTRRTVRTRSSKRGPLDAQPTQLKKPKLEFKPEVLEPPTDPLEPASGPPKPPTNSSSDTRPDPPVIRTSVRVDYESNLCTQFVKTGRCRYGDNCKFLHERESVANKPNLVKNPPHREKPVPTSQPGNCSICQTPEITDPVKPPCQHVCCQPCFLNASRERQQCRVCQKVMSGFAENIEANAK